MLGELAGGVSDGLRGATYLARHPRLWIWVLAPAVVAAVLLILVVGWLLGVLSGPIAGLAAVLPGHWADNVLKLVAGVVLAFASLSIFIALAALIAGPFNEMLSEAIEEHLTGVRGPKFRFGRFIVDLVIGMVHAARRVVVYIVVMISLLIVGIAVPVVGTVVAAIGAGIATARFASYEAFDAIWSRRGWRYRAKIDYLRGNRWRTLGLGAVVAALLVVPGLNVIGLSIGATAATLRVVQQELHLARDGRPGTPAADRASGAAGRT